LVFRAISVLCDGGTLSMHERAEQMHLSSLCARGAFEDFAIDSHSFEACSYYKLLERLKNTQLREQNFDIPVLKPPV
jgi:hypothetical protein